MSEIKNKIDNHKNFEDKLFEFGNLLQNLKTEYENRFTKF